MNSFLVDELAKAALRDKDCVNVIFCLVSESLLQSVAKEMLDISARNPYDNESAQDFHQSIQFIVLPNNIIFLAQRDYRQL